MADTMHADLAAAEAAIVRMVRALAEHVDPDRVLHVLLTEVSTLFEADTGMVYRWDDRAQRLVLVQAFPEQTARRAGDGPRHDGLTRQAIEGRRPLLMANYGASLPDSQSADTRALYVIMVAPLLLEGRLLTLADGEGRADLPIGAFLIPGDAPVLIDAGYGPRHVREMTGGNLLGHLRQEGYEPHDIAIVALTHLHPSLHVAAGKTCWQRPVRCPITRCNRLANTSLLPCFG